MWLGRKNLKKIILKLQFQRIKESVKKSQSEHLGTWLFCIFLKGKSVDPVDDIFSSSESPQSALTNKGKQGSELK